MEKIETTNELFISHGIFSNESGHEDVYFESIPNLFLDKNKHVTILYLNHMKKDYKALSRKYIQKQNSSISLLMPKVMGFKNYVKFLKFNWQAVHTRIKIYRNYRESEKFKSIIILDSLFSLMKRETYSNYYLLLISESILEISHIDNIFITLEGHAYEEQLIKLTSRISPKTAVWLRQHSPISLAQTGIFNMLKSLDTQVNVLTTGPTYSEFLASYSKKLNALVLGTKKSREINLSRREGNSVLVAPEGTEESTLDFLKFIFNLDKRFNDYHFICRIHPNLIKSFRIKRQIQKNRSKSNFYLSTNSLETDFLETNFTLFRGSAVAIESLAYNNLPIYLNFDGDMNLNIFSILNLTFPVLENVLDQSNFLNILARPKEDIDKVKIYKRLFVPIQKSTLDKICH